MARPLEGLKLRLSVVDDPALAAAIVRVRGEWIAQTGADFQVEETTEKDVARAEALPADAVICPSHLLGVLAERELLAPVPQRILHDAQWGGIFDLLKLREAAWGREIMAVPFGSPVFCCYYRADVLEKLGRRPPRTWAEYEEIAKLLATQKPNAAQAAWCGTIEPLSPGWAGLVLLARAAPYAKHRDNYSALFNIETMAPLVAGPPFVQALEELVAAAKLGPADRLSFDPTATRAAFWNGKCGMALTWPTAAIEGKGERGEGREKKVDEKAEGKGERKREESAEGRTVEGGEQIEGNAAGGLVASATSTLPQDIRIGFAELPGSRRVFNLGGKAWDRRTDDDDPQVPLLAIAGRLGVVSKKSAHADAVFQLLLWLSDDRMSPQVSAVSPATTLFRQSNLKSPGQWVEKPVPAAAALQYGEATEATLRHEQWLGALRIPGRAEYLAALDEAVAAAVRGEKPARDALLQAAAKWRKITERLGLDRQRAAYRHSLGLE